MKKQYKIIIWIKFIFYRLGVQSILILSLTSQYVLAKNNVLGATNIRIEDFQQALNQRHSECIENNEFTKPSFFRDLFTYEDNYINEIKRAINDFYASDSVEYALKKIETLKDLKNKLQNRYRYSLKKISQITCSHTIGVLTLNKSYRENILVQLDKLPAKTIHFLQVTGYYHYVKKNSAHIFFVADVDTYKKIFEAVGVENPLATIENYTNSILFHGKMDDIQPITLAAALIHETHHLKNYSNYLLIYMGEKDAFQIELEYWEKIKKSTIQLTKKEKEIIEKTIPFILKFNNQGS